MLQSWFKLAFRNATRFGLFTTVNIASLALGFACCIVIILYVQDELSYDRFHVDRDRIYRITTSSTFNGSENRYSRTPVPLAELIKNNVKDVEATARMTGREATIYLETKGTKNLENNFFFADPDLLQILTFNFVHGDAATSLQDKKSVIISERIAQKYFGSAGASLGKNLVVENRIDLAVSGVFKDWPSTSHVSPEIITHFDNYFELESPGIREYLQHDWIYTSVHTYILKKERASTRDITQQVNHIREVYADDRVKKHIRYTLQPLSDIHLRSDFSYESNANSYVYLYIFSIVAVLILVIACFNFINLSIARSLRRNKEIGIKKALGVERHTLVTQLLAESLLYVVVAFAISLILVYGILPVIHEITGKQLSLLALLSPQTIALVLSVIAMTGILAGGYPAFYITAIDTYKALKGQVPAGKGKFQIRKVLVVVQFLIAISMILFTLQVEKQLTYMRERPLGFDTDFILTVPLFSESFNSILGSRIDADYRKRMIAYEESVLTNSNIQAITCSSFLPGQGAISALIKTDSLTEESNVFIPLVSVDYDFIEAYGIKLLSGRNFSRSFGTDHLQAFIINEEAVRSLGFKNATEAIGKPLSAVGKEGTVVGVISNYHVQGLQFALQPLVLEVAASKFSTFSIKINPSAAQECIALLKREWDKFFPESIFAYSFLDEALDNNYQQEQRLGDTVFYSSMFTYLIAGLGLFGLAAYLNEQRVKEIAIRKVLGATARSIFATLSVDFLKMITLAFVLAIPTALYCMNQWLNNFYYKTPITFSIFVWVLVSTAAVVLITISYQTVKASQTDPANVLKTD
jgi:putative ABC transport system permease protein